MSLKSDLNLINTYKGDIKQAIIDKGVDMTGVALSGYAEKIGEISGGGGGSTDYRNKKGSISGLASLGWDEDSIGYANANCNEYSSETVTDANKALYGVVNSSNLSGYSSNANMVYVPYFTLSASNKFTSFKYIKTVPLFDTSSWTSILSMFWDCTNLISVPKFDTSNMTSKSAMFHGCRSLTSVPKFDTSKVTDMSRMFENCTSLTSVPAFDTSNVTSVGVMFSNCKCLTAVPAFNTSKVTSMESFVEGCTALTSVPAFDTSNVTNMLEMFYNCSSLTSVPEFDTSKVKTMYDMFKGCSSLTSVPEFDTSNVTDMYGMFSGCTALTSVPAFDTSKVKDMYNMFYGCSSLTSVPAFDTSKVTDMRYMFRGCTKLQSIGGIDFSSITSYPTYFFYGLSTTLTHVIVNGSISFTWTDANGFKKLTALDYESIKSILTAMSNCTNPTTAKSFAFSRTITDQDGELAALVADCKTKGWTITGLTIK